MLLGGRVEREFDIELAEREVDWWAFMDLASFKGKLIMLAVDELPQDSMGLRSVRQSDELEGHKTIYREALRPQFHFSSRRGILGDANGLVFYEGEYHLFYQHYPYGLTGMPARAHWGHAVSTDLVHWQELPVALYPDQHSGTISGSAVVDWNNTADFQKGAEKTMIAIFTMVHITESLPPRGIAAQGLAFSNDRGRTWTKYEENPVLPTIVGVNRDPKVIWYVPDRKWVMALYLDRNQYTLLSSLDLKQWQRMSDVTIPGDTGECPEFFEIAIDGNPNDTRWIFYGGNGRYLVGTFDGKKFSPQSGPHAMQHGNCWYASQTFNDIPSVDGRRILIPWGRTSTEDDPFHYEGTEVPLYPGMSFEGAMGIPVNLTLRTTDEGLRLFANPVVEFESLRVRCDYVKAQTLHREENLVPEVMGELFDIVAEIAPDQSTEISFDIRGVSVVYDVQRQELSCANRRASLRLENGILRLRMLIDRVSIDIFGNDGLLYMPMGVVFHEGNVPLQIQAEGGSAQINFLQVFELKSIWKSEAI